MWYKKQHPDEEPTRLYMGVELEVDRPRNGTARISRYDLEDEIRELRGDGEIETWGDCSLNLGLEIVSHPCTLRYHHELFPWREIIRTCLEGGYRSHQTNTCGLHIHVSWDAASHKTKLKIAWFICSQQEHMERLARRGENTWTMYKKDVDGPEDERALKDPIRQAVNWSNGSSTFEFRLWRGTLRYESLMGAIDITHAIIKYCETTSPQDLLIETQAWDGFVQFVYDNKENYPFGWDYLVYRGEA